MLKPGSVSVGGRNATSKPLLLAGLDGLHVRRVPSSNVSTGVVPTRPRRGRAVAGRAAVQVTSAPPAAHVQAHQNGAIRYLPSGQAASWAFREPLSGSAEPLGATYCADKSGVNFAVFASSAIAVNLVLFTEEDLQQGKATFEIPLDPELNKTGDVWHVLLPHCDTQLLYGYRVKGPQQGQWTEAQEAAIEAARAARAAAQANPYSSVEQSYTSYTESSMSESDNGEVSLPSVPNPGQRYDDRCVVLDPYAKGIITAGRRRYGELGPELDYTNPSVLGLARTWPQSAGALPQPPEAQPFDWQGDQPLNLPPQESVVYEMHVRGFTQHHTSGVQAPGTYLGVVERLDYLQSLGVTSLELLPVHEFNELEYYSQIPGSDAYRFNFWGYSTLNFMTPMSRYSFAIAHGANAQAACNEFKLLVREAHKRGIEVILDVVFNHTCEGNEQGPVLSFRGLDNRVYYMLAPGGEYYNYSGCGNTLNCNQPVVRRFIVDVLRHWVTEYHVDGFRFDLASILTRAHSAWHPQEVTPSGLTAALHSGGAMMNEAGIMTDGAGVPTGTPLSDPPLVQMISEDPVLRNTKMIAEAWDCDGLNQVGAFPHYGGRWSEWNGTFRDTVRQFLKGTEGPFAGAFASAMMGSPQIYANKQPGDSDWWGNHGGRQWKGDRAPTHSINFITAHDGFTLADLVAYNEKKNMANGEDNRDGESHNLSWNCGEEGPTERLDVNRLRQRQMRNMVAALLLSHGVPMMLMGDEYGHSKRGNNNTYCHDSDLNWFDWDAARADDSGLARFTRRMIHLRRSRRELQRSTFVTDADVQWHGEAPNEPDWSDSSRLVAYTLKDHESGGGLYIAFNTAHVPKMLGLPQWQGRAWRVLVDSSKLAPYDALVPDEELSDAAAREAQLTYSMWTGNHLYPLLPWSCCVLESVPEAELGSYGRARPRL